MEVAFEFALAAAFVAVLALQVWGQREYRKLLAAQTPEVRSRWNQLSAIGQA